MKVTIIVIWNLQLSVSKMIIFENVCYSNKIVKDSSQINIYFTIKHLSFTAYSTIATKSNYKVGKYKID